ncbi:hypothetical protein ACP70R_050206 [Stipagrostis hirtigluma subsp. patula]
MSMDPELVCVPLEGEKGASPLYLAISLGDVEIDPHLFDTSGSQAKATLSYYSGPGGRNALHAAVSRGQVLPNLDAVKILLQRRPDCVTLRDRKGRTFLHVAVEKERYKMVQYACRRMPQEISSVLNVQDNNGDTALHRAVHVGNLEVFNCLIQNRHVDLNISNNDELTPLDLSWCRIPPLFYYGLNPQCRIQLTLQLLGAPCGGIRPDLLSDKHIPKVDNSIVLVRLTNSAQVMGIVSVLVATVTFASAFTLPGGYYQSGSNNAGAALLAGSYAFDAFILSDTLAFISSCLATFSLIFAAVPAMDINTRLRYFEISALLLRNSGRSFVVAFAMGLYLALASVAHTTAIAVCMIISISSLYGNSEAWQILAIVNTACARLRTRVSIAWTCVLMFYNVLVPVFLHFRSFVIIFGLPAIWK